MSEPNSEEHIDGKTEKSDGKTEVDASSSTPPPQSSTESPSGTSSDVRPKKVSKFKSVDKTDVSLSFSRRKSEESQAHAASSVFSQEPEEKPAWMKNKHKYEKYGSRPQHQLSQISDQLADDRYSKYVGSRQNERSDRIRRDEPREREDRYRERDERIQDERYERPTHRGPSDERYESDKRQKVNSYNSYRTFHTTFNRENRDINSIVRSHYNQRTYQAKMQGSRTNSPIYKLRNFNNAIKYMMLGNFYKKGDASRPGVILDLCCGKGGDLNKCEFIKVNQYVGIDISDASIKEAFSRYNKNKARFIPQLNQERGQESRRFNFDACFATGDCFSKSVPEILEPNFPGIIEHMFPVDCVSMQFAMHYAFESEDKVKTMLMNVTKSLRPGGMFVGTVPSSDFIKDKIVKKEFLEDRKFGNELYSVTFEKDVPEDGVFRNPYGNKYTYYLKDAIDDVPEYVVPFEAFRLLCEDFGLILKYKKNFIDIFNQEIPKYFSKLNKNLIDGMKRSDGKYGAEGMEKEAVGFYIGFAFEKVGN